MKKENLTIILVTITLVAVIGLVIGFGIIFFKPIEPKFGTTIQSPSRFKQTLVRNLTSTMATSSTIYLSNTTDIKNHDLTTAELGDCTVYTINPGAGNEEKVLCTGIDATTDTITGCRRGLKYHSINSESDNVKIHSAGETVIISNDQHCLAIQYAQLDGDPTIQGEWNFAGIANFMIPPTSTAPTTSTQLATKGYADAIANQGAATSTTDYGGILEVATATEMASTTDLGADIPLAITTLRTTSTPVTLNSNPGKWIPVTESDGYFNQDWFNWNELFTFDAGFIVNSSSTFTSNVTIGGNATTTGSQSVGSLLFSGDSGQSMGSKFSRYYYSTTSHTILSSLGAEAVIATTTLYGLEVGDTIKYRIWGNSDSGSGTGGGFLAVKFGGVTTTELLIDSAGGVNDFIWRGEILNINDEMQQSAGIGIDEVSTADGFASTTFKMLSGDTSQAINLYVQGLGPYNVITNIYFNGFTVEIIR